MLPWASHPLRRAPSGAAPDKFSSTGLLLHPALALLWEAHCRGQDSSGSAPGGASLSVTLDQLGHLGMTGDQLRRLVVRGHIELVEPGAMSPDGSPLQSRDGHPLRGSDRVSLSPAGAAYLESVVAPLTQCGQSRPAPRSLQGGVADQAAARRALPCWDSSLRELRLGGVLVKRFRALAANQELILESFQEQGWPRRIDDPLPPRPNTEGKLRLRDTITSLNRNQENRCIRFRGDGTGRGARWEALAEALPRPWPPAQAGG